jgi:hypothetical protein
MDNADVHPGRREIVVWTAIFFIAGLIVFTHYNPVPDAPALPYLAFLPAALGCIACFYTFRLFDAWDGGYRGEPVRKLQNASSNWAGGSFFLGIFLGASLLDVARAVFS